MSALTRAIGALGAAVLSPSTSKGRPCDRRDVATSVFELLVRGKVTEAVSDVEDDDESRPGVPTSVLAAAIRTSAKALMKQPAVSPRGGVDAAVAVFKRLVRGHVRETVPDLSEVSDLTTAARSIAIVTTASIPWMTGTSINPLLRAVYLARDGHDVTLVLPWVPSLLSQQRIFPTGTTFASSPEQAVFVHSWLDQQGFGDVSLRLLFYEAAYSGIYGSIMPLSAITDVFADCDVRRDVCILEEPEHLTWHHPGSPWPTLFRVVVGVVHTNYTEYARQFGFFGPQRAFLITLLNIWVCRSYCHRVIKLSDAVQKFPHSVTCNVHGVRERFLSLGRDQSTPRDKGAYFLAKALWTKGYAELLDLLRAHHVRTSECLPVALFGDGGDAPEIASAVSSDPALSAVRFQRGWADHSSGPLQRFRVCVNASVSEVVCTATAEALAMGKAVVCVEHPSNAFFATFPNCHVYRTPEEFSDKLVSALASDPIPLSEEDAFRLSWVAATERFYEAAKVPLRAPGVGPDVGLVDEALASAHSAISKLYPIPGEDFARKESIPLPADSAVSSEDGEDGDGDDVDEDFLSDGSCTFSECSDDK